MTCPNCKQHAHPKPLDGCYMLIPAEMADLMDAAPALMRLKELQDASREAAEHYEQLAPLQESPDDKRLALAIAQNQREFIAALELGMRQIRRTSRGGYIDE